MELKFNRIKDLEDLMTPEQKKRAKADYDKFYGIPYGHLKPIICIADDDGDDYLRLIDIDKWDD